MSNIPKEMALMKKIIPLLLVVQSLLYADFENEKWYECTSVESANIIGTKPGAIGIKHLVFGGVNRLQLVNRNVIVEDIYFATEVAKGSRMYKFKNNLGEFIVEETEGGVNITNLYDKINNYIGYKTHLSCKVRAR